MYSDSKETCVPLRVAQGQKQGPCIGWIVLIGVSLGVHQAHAQFPASQTPALAQARPLTQKLLQTQSQSRHQAQCPAVALARHRRPRPRSAPLGQLLPNAFAFGGQQSRHFGLGVKAILFKVPASIVYVQLHSPHRADFQSLLKEFVIIKSLPGPDILHL